MVKAFLMNPITTRFQRAALCLALFFILSNAPAKAAPPASPFAMCSNGAYRTNPAYPAALYDAGARMVRLDVTFGDVRKQPGNDPNRWDWSQMETLARLKTAQPGVEYLILLGYSAAWAEDAQERKMGRAAAQRGVRTLPPDDPANLYGQYVYENRPTL